MEPKRCRLVGTVFLGAIVVTDGSKFEKKKNSTQEEQEMMGRTKTGGGKKMAITGI